VIDGESKLINIPMTIRLATSMARVIQGRPSSVTR
jgi:hypothetical protein